MSSGTSANDNIINKLDYNDIINVNGLLIPNKNVISNNIHIIKEGISQWEMDFIKTHGRRPTYCEMRAEFG